MLLQRPTKEALLAAQELNVRFNTVNGKCCCNSTRTKMIQNVNIASFNTVNGKCCCNEIFFEGIFPLIRCFNTVNGKCCCNYKEFAPETGCKFGFNTVNGKCCCNAIVPKLDSTEFGDSFNTVNGKCCCNCLKLGVNL